MNNFERTRYERLVLTIQGIQLEMQQTEKEHIKTLKMLEELEDQVTSVNTVATNLNVYLTRLNIAMVALQQEANSIPETER